MFTKIVRTVLNHACLFFFEKKNCYDFYGTEIEELVFILSVIL